jgi:DNA-binding CsgD family transcriptional regulator
MEWPRYREVRALVDFVGEVEAAALSDRDQLVVVMLAGLVRLIGCDSALCTDYPATTATDPQIPRARRREPELWQRCLRHHPTVSYWNRGGADSVVRISDVLGQRAYRRLPIYGEFFRPAGLEYKLDARIHLTPHASVDVGCARGSRDFADRERMLLGALSPYMASLLRRCEATDHAARLQDNFGLSRREAEVLTLLCRGQRNDEIAGRLFLAPGTVEKHLEHVYAKLGVGSRMLAAVRARALAPSPDPQDRTATALLLRLGVDPTVVSTVYGLTDRERQVIALASAGYSNAEIGGELSLAAGTIKKHLEHVYAKLGVRGRAEAAALRLVS